MSSPLTHYWRDLRIRPWFQRLSQPSIVISLLLIGPLAVFALYPFLVLVWESIGVSGTRTLDVWRSVILGQPSSAIPEWTTRHSRTFVWEPLRNSVVITVGTTVLSVLLGGTLAMVVGLTDVRFKSELTMLAIYQIILPPFALATVWILMGHRLSLPTELTYGPIPIVVVLSISYYPFVYLIVTAALSNVDRRLIEVSFVHGVSKRTALREVLLPLVGPAVVGSAALVGFLSLAVFAPIEILGAGPDPYRVLSTQLFSLYRDALSSPTLLPAAAVISLILTAVSVIPFAGYYVMIKLRSRETLSGGGSYNQLVTLGRYRTAVSVLLIGLLGASVVVPLVVLAVQSVSPGLGRVTLESLSLDAYRQLWSTTTVRYSLVNSLLVGVLVATIGTVVSFFASYVVTEETPWPLKSSIYGASLISFVLPGVALGVAYLLLVSRPLPIPLLGGEISLRFLYGTLFLVVIVVAVKNLPFGIQSYSSTLVQVDHSLLEAAHISNADFRTAIREILVPLVNRSTIAAWTLMFIFAVKELDVIMFLYAPQPFVREELTVAAVVESPPIMFQIFSLMSQSQDPDALSQAAALLLFVSVVIFLCIIAVTRATDVDFENQIQM